VQAEVLRLSKNAAAQLPRFDKLSVTTAKKRLCCGTGSG